MKNDFTSLRLFYAHDLGNFIVRDLCKRYPGDFENRKNLLIITIENI